MDKGTETGGDGCYAVLLVSIYHDDIDDSVDSVIYGPSISNQV